MRRPLPALVLVALLWLAPALAVSDAASEGDFRDWVEEMKLAPRGPFEAVRWFCRDGSVLPPRPYACVDHGGGIQHGVLNARAQQLREHGFLVANVLASLDASRFTGESADHEALRQLVLERFLIERDAGWIFRGAASYRGAFQREDEEAASRALLRALLADPAWRERARFLPLRELARWLPIGGQDDASIRVRSLAARLGDAEPGFAPLRARIHSMPEAADARRVREHARSDAARGDPRSYEELARAIDELFAFEATSAEVKRLVGSLPEGLGGALRAELTGLASDVPRLRLAAAARGMEAIRRELAGLASPHHALPALRISLVLEREAFASGQAAIEACSERGSQLALVGPLAAALYGTGLIGDRQLAALRESLERLAAEEKSVALGVWRSELAYLLRAGEWSRRWLLFHFGAAMQQLLAIEPLASAYEADRLRGSPLLPYTLLLDTLSRDAQQLAGVQDRVLGRGVGSGLRALNPGVARGRLRSAARHDELEQLAPDSIALLAETVSELPPVAGILTLGEGSSLSHVQLLARNLGIPNAVVSDAIAEELREVAGRWLEVAVSPGGVVQIDLDDERTPDATSHTSEQLSIRVDVDRLDLAQRSFLALDALRSEHSGRICGPKGANLGELRAHFGDRVPDGFVIPFGVFRKLLEQPIEPGGPSAFQWLREQYALLRTLEGDARAVATSALLSRMRSWIGARTLGSEFRRKLARNLERLGPGGVFVRSDTNVEDLPHFTGAGLNLTVPNVIGSEQLLDAILRVWASPFSERSHAWRQAHMDQPEWVLPSVLVQRAVAADKSGVMLTVDTESADGAVLSVAVGEGVGGVIDGQAAESLRIDRVSGRVRLLAQATATHRNELDPTGGMRRRPASGREMLLEPQEIAALIELAEGVRSFPGLRGADGDYLPADVEFAFRAGELVLLQIRPLVTSRRALENAKLRALDAPLQARSGIRVELAAPPLGCAR